MSAKHLLLLLLIIFPSSAKCSGEDVSIESVFKEVAPGQLSPRLEQLANSVETSQTNALEHFWREVHASGSPLLEPVTGSTTETLMALLWRAETPTTSVIVIGGLNPDNKSLKTFQNLEGTDVWYK